jgi:hypothetical protein
VPKGIHPNSLANLKRTPGPGRPKGSKSLAYSVRGLVAEALADPETLKRPSSA